MSEPTEALADYVTTKEECERGIKGVCEGCGRSLTAIETVDNSMRPTFWQGCEHCSCFRAGIEFEYYTIARKLVEDGEIVPYSYMSRCEYENTPERLSYYLDSQTAGLSRQIKSIHKLLETDNPTTELEAEVARLREEKEAFKQRAERCPWCGNYSLTIDVYNAEDGLEERCQEKGCPSFGEDIAIFGRHLRKRVEQLEGALRRAALLANRRT